MVRTCAAARFHARRAVEIWEFLAYINAPGRASLELSADGADDGGLVSVVARCQAEHETGIVIHPVEA